MKSDKKVKKQKKEEKTTKQMLVEQNSRSKHLDVMAVDWYKALHEEIASIITETVYQAQQSLLEGKLSIGEAINKQKKNMPVTELVQYLAIDLKISERELWYCSKFFEDYSKIKKEIENNKAISWNKVKLLLSSPKEQKDSKPCSHPHFTVVKICDDCGSKIKED